MNRKEAKSQQAQAVQVDALDHERAEYLAGIRIGQEYCTSHQEGEGLRGIGGWYPDENPSTRG